MNHGNNHHYINWMRRFNDAGSRNKATRENKTQTSPGFVYFIAFFVHFPDFEQEKFPGRLIYAICTAWFPPGNFQLIQENHGNCKIYHVTFIYVKRKRFNVITYKYKSVHKERCEMYSVWSHLAQWVDRHQTLSDGRVLLSVTHLNADRSIFSPFTLWSDKKR